MVPVFSIAIFVAYSGQFERSNWNRRIGHVIFCSLKFLRFFFEAKSFQILLYRADFFEAAKRPSEDGAASGRWRSLRYL